jgi:sulfatase maturation enzyme AslB (radical SAM superfamily)
MYGTDSMRGAMTPQLFRPDPEFSNHFKNLHQVFMYITDRCNLECEQCIYKPSISHFINEEIELETALDLLSTFRGMGASKVTFLGGEPHDWLPVYDEISRKVRNKHFEISVRLPQCFVTKSEFARNPEFYGYCPVKLGERVMVHPNGTIRICSNLICTGYGVARYHDRRIEWDNSSGNELAGHDLTRNTPCTNRGRHRKYGDLVPVCFSFKPDPEEHVWQKRLDWDNRRISEDDQRALG